MNLRRGSRRPATATGLRRGAVTLATSLGLVACGGSVSIGFGYDGRNDRPPSVSLAASAQTAAPGQTVRLFAAASDDYSVDAVEFYRLDENGATLLGVDGGAPYRWDVAVLAGSATAVQFFARAVDDANQRADSDRVTVDLLN